MKPVPALHTDVRELILAARQKVAHAVNAGLTMAYWQVGERIRREALAKHRHHLPHVEGARLRKAVLILATASGVALLIRAL